MKVLSKSHLGNLTVLGNPIKMSEYPCQYDTCAPELGADNKDVFEKLGFSEEELKTYEAPLERLTCPLFARMRLYPSVFPFILEADGLSCGRSD